MAEFNTKKPSRTKRDGMLLNLQLLHCNCVHLLKIIYYKLFTSFTATPFPCGASSSSLPLKNLYGLSDT